jgi:hypothetical protein
MTLSAGWSGRLAGISGGGIRAKAGSANAPMIKLATGDIIAGLIASFSISIFLRFFISNLRGVPPEKSPVVPIPNELRVRAIAKGRRRSASCYDIGHALPECANLLKSADGDAVWTISESASAHSRARSQHHHPRLDSAFQNFDDLARIHLLALRRVWPFGVIVSEVYREHRARLSKANNDRSFRS